MKKRRKKEEIHSPTLDSILMVEKAIEKHNYIGKYQLWKQLPRKMMYQTLCCILNYLESSGKINIVGTKISLIKKPEQEEKKTEGKTEEIPRYLT